MYEKEGFSAEMLEEPEPMAVVNETHRLFKDALDRGIADNVIPEAMSRKLDESLFVFSGFKTAQSLGEAASWLRQADGTVKPFNSFLTDVRKVNEKYNERYLRAEYEFAVGSAQMAASWAEVEASGDSYNLQYRTASDERVRSSHQAMAEITLPPSDPFWDSYYPPNGWGCRCTAVQVRKAKYETTDPDQAMQAGNHATEIRGKDGGNRGAMFRFNPGKQGQIFPPKHPYYKMAGQGYADANAVREKLKSFFRIENEQDTKNRTYITDALSEVNKQKQWFKNKPIKIRREFRKNRNGSTDGKGKIWLKKDRLEDVANGIAKLKNSEQVTGKEADSLATLWHEITHNRNNTKKGPISPLERKRMELANEFVARNTLPEFYDAFGSKIQHPELMKSRQSTGYNKMVRNYETIIKETGADHRGVVRSVKQHLFNKSYADQENGLVNAIVKNGAEIDERVVRDLVANCNSSSEQKFVNLAKKLLIKH